MFGEEKIQTVCQHFFSIRGVNIWNNLLEETVSAVWVISFKKRLDKLERAQIHTVPTRFCKVENPGKMLIELVIPKGPWPIITDEA